MSRLLFLFFLIALVDAARYARALPVVTVKDAHGLVKSRQTFLWWHRLGQVKDSVQLRLKVSKDRMILWYIPKDDEGYDTAPIYNIDESITFSEADELYNEGRRGAVGLTYHR